MLDDIDVDVDVDVDVVDDDDDDEKCWIIHKQNSVYEFYLHIFIHFHCYVF